MSVIIKQRNTQGCLQPEDAVVVFVRSCQCGSVCNKQPLQPLHWKDIAPYTDIARCAHRAYSSPNDVTVLLVHIRPG